LPAGQNARGGRKIYYLTRGSEQVIPPEHRGSCQPKDVRKAGAHSMVLFRPRKPAESSN